MVRWWKDRDKFFPVPPVDRPNADAPDEPDVSGEDIGDVANDDYDEVDEVEPPDRSLDD